MTAKERLKEWRRLLGLTQQQFCDATGIPLRTLCGYEGGTRRPGEEALAAIAETGCNINWLLTGKGEMRDVDRSNALPDGPLRVIEGEARPLAPEEAAASTARRLAALAALIDGLESPQEQAALLDDLLSRAQSAAEMHALKQAVAELRTALKKTA